MQLKSFLFLYIIIAMPCNFCLSKGYRFQELLKPIELEKIYEPGVKVLSRKELYNHLLKKNITFKQSKIDLEISTEAYQLVYDTINFPRPTLSGGYTQSKTFGSTSGYSTYAKETSLGLGLSGSTDFGLTYTLALPTITRTQSYLFEWANQTEDSHTASVSANLTFPLLKNSVFFVRGFKKIGADLDLEIADIAVKASLLSTFTAAESIYYDVLLKSTKLKVQERSLAASKALLEDIREMIKAGDSDKLAALKVELQVSQIEVDYLTNKGELNTAVAAFLEVLSTRPLDSMLIFPDPKELYEELQIPKITLEEAIKKAYQQRPDYLVAVMNRKKNDLAVQSGFAQTLPKLDLKASYGYSESSESLSEAFSRLTKFTQPGFSVGFEFSYTFSNDSDKSNYRVSKLNLQKSEAQIAILSNQIRKELSSLIDNIELAKLRLKNAEQSRALSEQKLSFEFTRFKAGESNIRNIIDFQTEVANSRIAEITSRIDLNKNWSGLRTALGEFPEGIRL